MSVAREQIGETQHYRGRAITAHSYAPDVLMRIDGQDYGVYLSKEAGFRAKMKDIDREEERLAQE